MAHVVGGLVLGRMATHRASCIHALGLILVGQCLGAEVVEVRVFDAGALQRSISRDAHAVVLVGPSLLVGDDIPLVRALEFLHALDHGAKLGCRP